MRYEIETHPFFHLAAELEWLDSRRYCLNQYLAMLKRVLPTVGPHHLHEPAISKVFPQGTLLHEHPAICRHARIHLQHTEYTAKILITRLLHINASKPFEPLHSPLLGGVDPGLAIVKVISHHYSGRRIYQLSPPRRAPGLLDLGL